MKYETFSGNTFLVDSTAVDTYNYTWINNEMNFNISRLLRVDNYYSLSNKLRYTVFESCGKSPTLSVSNLFKNAVWLERELIEMYGTLIKTSYDSRNLLLDYSFTDNPMLKTYPTEGYVDVYYDVFRDQLSYVNHDFIEL